MTSRQPSVGPQVSGNPWSTDSTRTDKLSWLGESDACLRSRRCARFPPTVRAVTSWLCRRPDTLTEDERPRLEAILDRCPELQAASGQVRAFATRKVSCARATGGTMAWWRQFPSCAATASSSTRTPTTRPRPHAARED